MQEHVADLVRDRKSLSHWRMGGVYANDDAKTVAGDHARLRVVSGLLHNTSAEELGHFLWIDPKWFRLAALEHFLCETLGPRVHVRADEKCGIGVLVLVGIAKMSAERSVIVDGFKRGLRAAWFPEQEWESLLPLSIEVRRQLRVHSPPVYAPIRSSDLRASGLLPVTRWKPTA
jgi:hypothetical protein